MFSEMKQLKNDRATLGTTDNINSSMEDFVQRILGTTALPAETRDSENLLSKRKNEKRKLESTYI